ncbi:hypothetical protein GCM10023107_90830 [Actinoplanes octamycinicus]|nr:hypothetical protein Aoc01nite_38200 [Actinoplanes octamycinicus]
MNPRTPCPECGQDWVRSYRFKDGGSRFYVCKECDSLWWSKQSVGIARPDFVDEVVAGRLGVSGNPWGEGAWGDVMEPAPESD